LCA
jgi:hypothetical protein